MTRPSELLLDYPFAETPAPGGMQEVRPGIWWLRLPLPFDLNHINIWLLDDGPGWTLVDTGLWSPENVSIWERLLGERIPGKSLHRIVVTHFHPDHVGMAKFLSERVGCTVWLTDKTRDHTRNLYEDSPEDTDGLLDAYCRRHGFGDVPGYVEFCTGGSYRRIVSGAPVTTASIDEGDELRIGGRLWKVMIVEGHSDGHAVLYCADEQLLISGDQVLPHITSNVSKHASYTIPESPLHEFLASLRRLESLPEETLVLPSHGRVFVKLHERLRQLHEHHDRMLARTLDTCVEAHSAGEAAPKLFRRELSGHNAILAFGEALAHLVYLEKAGSLRTEEQGGRLTFVKS